MMKNFFSGDRLRKRVWGTPTVLGFGFLLAIMLTLNFLVFLGADISAGGAASVSSAVARTSNSGESNDGSLFLILEKSKEYRRNASSSKKRQDYRQQQQQQQDDDKSNKIKEEENGDIDWRIILPNAVELPNTNYTPRLNVIWSRGWYNVFSLAAAKTVPMGYYNQKRQGTLFKLLPEQQQQLWNFSVLCGGYGNSHFYLWIRSTDLKNFINLFQNQNLKYNTNQCNFTLVTSDGDDDIPDRVSRFSSVLFDSPLVHQWYAQNVVANHPKLVPIPIGLDLHAYRGLPTGMDKHSLAVIQTMQKVRSQARAWEHRNGTFLVDVGDMSQCRRREEIRGKLKSVIMSLCDMLPMSVRSKLAAWETYASYQFAVAAPGCGWDTHRLWEYLFFGTVPVVLSTELDRLLLPAHVPVLVVDAWSEICQLQHNVSLYQSMVQRYQGWIRNAHYWLEPSLWIPRDQARMDALCRQSSPGCLEASQMGHRMNPSPFKSRKFACPSEPNPKSQRRCRSRERNVDIELL